MNPNVATQIERRQEIDYKNTAKLYPIFLAKAGQCFQSSCSIMICTIMSLLNMAHDLWLVQSSDTDDRRLHYYASTGLAIRQCRLAAP